MVYLLDEWFVDIKNEERVRELITELKSDIRDKSYREDDMIIQEIEALGEIKIVELLKQNKL